MSSKTLQRHLSASSEVRNQTATIVGETRKLFKASEPFTGIAKTYAPKDNDGIKIAPENKELTTTIPERLEYTFGFLEKLLDWIITRDDANTRARADIEIDDVILAAQVPIDTITEGRKILTELRDLLKEAPTLDASYKWENSGAPFVYKRGPIITYRYEKAVKPITMTKATDKHAETIEKVTYDVVVGEFSTLFLSGLISSETKAALLAECERLIIAFKGAQARANEAEVTPQNIGAVILGRFKAILNT